MNELHFTDNHSINQWINYCLSLIDCEDAPKFIRSFKNYSGNDQQSLHVFRELILGAYLISKGINVRNNLKIFDKTPDWSVVDNNSIDCEGIVELVNLNIDIKTNKYIESQKNKIAVYWVGENKNRLYQSLLNKVTKYKGLISNNNVPYIVAVFVDFRLHFDLEEFDELLNKKPDGLFHESAHLSGVLYINDSNGKYLFNYFENDLAKNKIKLPSGEFALNFKTYTKKN